MNNTFIRALIVIAFFGAFQADADAAQRLRTSFAPFAISK